MMKAAAVLWVFFSTSFSYAYNFHLPNVGSETAKIQVGKDGLIYAAVANQLMRLDPQLTLVQNITLSSPVVRISLANGGEDLVTCKADLSCVVYDASDLLSAPQPTDVTLASESDVTLFSSGTYFYTGSMNNYSRIIRLSRGDISGQRSYASNTKNYSIVTSSFQNRKFLYGFAVENCSYFVVKDKVIEFGLTSYLIRVIRTCQNSSCCPGGTACYFTALYEEFLECGELTPDFNVCSVSLVEDYGSTSGYSILLSLCSENSLQDTNLVCSVSLHDIDSNMNKAYDNCISGDAVCASTSWSAETSCSAMNFPGRFCFSSPIGDSFICASHHLIRVPHKELLHLNSLSSGGSLLSSVPIKLDGLSLLMVSYKTLEGDGFIGMFQLLDVYSQQKLRNALYTKQTSSPVLDLKWNNGLDYVVAITQTEILTIPLEECSLHQDCASCVSDRNPLCGWCVAESKCSIVSNCGSGSSSDLIDWIRSDPTRPFCVLPENLVLNSQQQVNISVYPIRIPNYDGDLSYNCLLEAINGALSVSIPASEVETGGSYVCILEDNQVPFYSGIKTEFGLKFQSSQSQILLERDSAVLNIYNCSAARRCSDCLSSDNCGWCTNSKQCTHTAEDCTDSRSFTQLAMGQTFQDVCPLLLQRSGTTKYLHPVRITNDLQLSAYNLPPAVSPYSYKCQIGGLQTEAVRNNETSITCLIIANQITIQNGSETTVINILWIGPDLVYKIGTFSQIYVGLYDCNQMASDCSSCVQDMTGYPCGWCKGPESRCSVAEECTGSSSTLLTMGTQCPAPIITSFSPMSGPPDGGTVVTIHGTDLGVSINDFASEHSIRVGDAPCVSLNTSYISGKQVLCRTTNATQLGGNKLVINLTRVTGPVTVIAQELFHVLLPTVVSVWPVFGPIAGGSILTIEGTDFDIGNRADVTLYGYNALGCNVLSRNSTVITCRTIQVPQSQNESGSVVVHIDSQYFGDPMVVFQYKANPVFLSVSPRITIPSGGIVITFTGTNMDVAQEPKLIIDSASYPCSIVNSSALSCITPKLTTEVNNILTYELQLDNVTFPSMSTTPQLQIQVESDPVNLKLITEIVTLGLLTAANFVLIQGENLQSVRPTEYTIRIGGHDCGNISITTNYEILCIPPPNPILNHNAEAEIMVIIGRNLNYALAKKLMFIAAPQTATGSTSMNPLYLLPFVLIPLLLLCCIIIVILWLSSHFRKINRKGVTGVTNKEFYLVQEQARMNAYDGFDVGAKRRKQTKSSADLMEEMTRHLPHKLLIAQEQLQVLDVPLGQGQFGTVYKGNVVLEVNGRNRCQDVAVKSFKDLMSSDVQDIFAEIFKMQDLSHPNVMTLIGVCISVIRGPCIVMPYMENGSLLSYLKNERSNIYLSFYAGDDTIASVKKLLLRMCYQIALGMDYLSTNQIIHRDLAARNCLLDSEGNIKVSDFGLSEDIYVTGYFRQKKDDAVRLPFKWMAPESLRDGLFTHKSDVWSFGITCWEIFTGGRTPYPGVDAIDLFRYLEEGVRLENPENAASDDDIYSLMLMCWNANPESRPSFQDMPRLISNKLEPISEYMEMSMFLQPQRFEEYLIMNSIQNNGDMRANVDREDIGAEKKEMEANDFEGFEEMKLDTAF